MQRVGSWLRHTKIKNAKELMSQTTLGILGGTGLYELEGLADFRPISVDTPFGPPSSQVITGRIDDVHLLFIARHGEGHVLSPSEINYRANIYALKSLGAQWCVSVSAVGSLKEEYAPGDVILPDQFIDWTKNRISTFFGSGICAHVPFASPVCPVLHQQLFLAAEKVAQQKNVSVHSSGTYLCMEGPAFSTHAESTLYRSWGAHLIGMTAMPEAKLAREAELAYAMLALVTDYDCWKSRSADVQISEILEVLKRNVSLAKEVLAKLIGTIATCTPSAIAADALADAIVTAPERISAQVKEDLRPIIGRYVS
jgi:5'-methylthioadenosine phosphorylase